ncbi:amino acid adenylation domain-containing protein [Streptomyces sp. NBC_01102]|uniref:amino acid adenylation domain-containing protein n=1 Tax=unclassified Streptomyces TaxID=2593676 RepID=UPI003870C143|nr:amino acid adenylation domain-containing protein [Streptomyces sp. NBC_01102]
MSNSSHQQHFECIDTAFRRQVAAHPDKIAAWDADGSSTFAELWEQAVRLAGALRLRGVDAGDAVGLHGVGDRDSIVAMLGILLAGGHFVPVDPAYPAERVERMMALSGASLLLRTAAHPPPGTVGLGTPHVRELIAQTLTGEADPAGLPAGSPDRLAYVLFTSGSTGVPKAVGVPHGALTALCLRDGPVRRSPDEVFLVNTILTFDPSMLEIWSALLVGASVLCAPRTALSLHETAALLADPRVTTAVLTPAVFALVAESHVEALRALRCLIVGGDVMPFEHAVRVRNLCPELELVNCYGPTENTVVSTAFSLMDWEPSGTSVPIGGAVAGSTCYVLDEELRPLPPGEVGDLYVGGDRLAVGYVGDTGLTQERFVTDPFSASPGARMYRTGDRACLNTDGTLEFRGREDAEIKVRGFRVNLAEVEALVVEDEDAAEAVALPMGTGHDRRVVAFVRPRVVTADVKEIRARVAERAPQHLVPDDMVLVAGFPLKASGKTDTAALAAGYRPAEPAGAVAAAGEGAGAVGDADVKTRLARMWEERTGGASAHDGYDFFSAGGSSLDLIRLIDNISSGFGVFLDFEDVYGLRDFDELLVMVQDRSQQERV